VRNVNIFRTNVTDHMIPREIMRRALVLSPGKDWTDPKTDAYKFLKRWALEQDERVPGKKPVDSEEENEKRSLFTIHGHFIPFSIHAEAKKLSPGKHCHDKRTKAYKFLKEWALEQDNNENSK